MNELKILEILSNPSRTRFPEASREDVLKHSNFNKGIQAISDNISSGASSENECCGTQASCNVVDPDTHRRTCQNIEYTPVEEVLP